MARIGQEHRLGLAGALRLAPLADQGDDGQHVGRQQHDQRADQLQRIGQGLVLKRTISGDRAGGGRRSPTSETSV